MPVKKQQLELDMEQQTGSKSGLKKGIRGGGPGQGIVTEVGFGKPGPGSRKAQGGSLDPGE